MPKFSKIYPNRPEGSCLVLTAFWLQGTTGIGNDPETSVANTDSESRVHGIDNLWVGGNGCIPDATASNPTRTSVRSNYSPPNSIYFPELMSLAFLIL